MLESYSISYWLKFLSTHYVHWSEMVIISRQMGGARGVMVIVVGNGHGDTSSNPGRGGLHFT